MNSYIKSVINLCEIMSCAVPPKSKVAGKDYLVNKGTKKINGTLLVL